MLKPFPVSHSLPLPANLEEKFLAPSPVPYLPTYLHTAKMITDQKSEPVNQTKSNVLLYKMLVVSYHRNRMLVKTHL